MPEIMQKVKSIIIQNSEIETIEMQDSLFDKGIDSIIMLYILNEIEIEFNIKIPDDELLISNFETINQICSLIEKLKEKEI